MDNSFNAVAPEHKQIEMLNSHVLFDCTCYTSFELIKETLPLFDDITCWAMYKYLNHKFIDEEDLEAVDRKIVKLKRIEQSINDANLRVFQDSSANQVDDIELIQ